MAEWANIFDLGEWDVYVQFKGITGSPSPDSFNYLVLASDLDPAIGTVSVDASGRIVCVLENASGGGSAEAPTIIAMPKFSVSGPARLTVSNANPLTADDSYFLSAIEVLPVGAETYEANFSETNQHQYASPNDWALTTQLPEEIQDSQGLSFIRLAPGF